MSPNGDGADNGFLDPLMALVGLDRETRAQVAAERTGRPIEFIRQQFAVLEAQAGRPFDDPTRRRVTEGVVCIFERDLIDGNDDPHRRWEHEGEAAARAGMTRKQFRRRLKEVEELAGCSLDEPIIRAYYRLAFACFDLHKDSLPPAGDPWWSQE